MAESAAAPHPGWRFAHERLAPLLADAEMRLKDAPLRSGCAAAALSEAEYAAWVQQQVTMIRQLSLRLEGSAKDINWAANQIERPGDDTAVLATYCGVMGRCFAACAEWGEAVWATTPPLSFAASFAELREIPAAIVAQMRPYVEIMGDPKPGQKGDCIINIDIQPLIDRAARLGNREVSRPVALSGANQAVAWVFLVFFILVALYACA